MNVSLLLLLVFGARGRPAGAKTQDAAVSPDRHAARLRGFWELHMKEVLLKGEGEPAPGQHLRSSQCLVELSSRITCLESLKLVSFER